MVQSLEKGQVFSFKSQAFIGGWSRQTGEFGRWQAGAAKERGVEEGSGLEKCMSLEWMLRAPVEGCR